MPVPNIASIGDNPSMKDLENYIIKLQRDLEWLLSNIDDMNINRLTAKSIFVDELSALTANLGHIIAGVIESVEIYGSKIATSRDSFPRAEMSETENLFRVMLSATNFAEFNSLFSFAGGEAPALAFEKGIAQLFLGLGVSSLAGPGLRVEGSELEIKATNGVYFNDTRHYGWSSLKDIITGKTLQQELTALTASISNLTTAVNNKANSGSSTGSSGSHNHGIANGTELMTVGGGSVTWFSAGNHSHTQN